MDPRQSLRKSVSRLTLATLLAALIASPAAPVIAAGARAAKSAPTTLASAYPGARQVGVASYYADRFEGRRTASGERYDDDKLTAAHRTLPLGTRVRVTEHESGRSVIVKVNDRGPYVAGRAIDLSKRAGERLGMTEEGLADVTIEVVEPPK